MAKDIYDQKITRATDWGGDASTGGKPVSGRRVQEYIKEEITALEGAVESIAAAQEQMGESATGITAEPNEDNTATVISLLGRDGSVIDECEVPLGGGTVAEDATKTVLTLAVSRRLVKEGTAVSLTYSYDHVYVSGDGSTGTPADIEVRVVAGVQTTYSTIYRGEVSATRTINITDYLLPGDNNVYVTARWTDTEGRERSKSLSARVKVVALRIESQLNLEAMLSAGGYDSMTDIPYKVSGSGEKSIYLLIDGTEQMMEVKKGTMPTTSAFAVDFSALAPGVHSLQLWAEMTDDAGDTLRSESIYITAIRKGEAAGAAIMFTDIGGHVWEGAEHLAPTLYARAYEPVDLQFGGYGGGLLTVTVDGQTQAFNADGQVQRYDGRFRIAGQHTIEVSAGTTALHISADVEPAAIDINPTAVGLVCSLSAEGRSNNEPAEMRNVWSDRGVDTTFEGVDWVSSGWTGSALRLIGGAKATINITPLQGAAVKSQGRTVELTLKISNVVRYDTPIAGIYDGSRGLRIQGDEIAYLTGQTTEYPDEDDPQVTHTREIKLSTNYQQGKTIKIAFVVDKQSERRVMHLYVDGNRVGADIYGQNYSFDSPEPQPIFFDSAVADIEVEGIRVYDTNLTDDQILDNHIADQHDISKMLSLHNENDVLTDTGGISMPALRSRGKGVILIVRPNLLTDVYETNNKKTDFDADVYFYSPLSQERDFHLQHCNIRIQGTSSTKYPSKNIRIYFNKSKHYKALDENGGKPYLTVGGEADSSNKYALRPGAVKQSVMTAKSDYSDSSMSLNTGGAKLFNDVMKELGLLTPPQRHQMEQGGVINVRAAIDGIPVDIFAATSIDSTPVYFGQYNFNNEKSKSGGIFGMEGVAGFLPLCPIALESLNNTNPLCLFQVHDVESDLETYFDSAFEFNYPEDVFWTEAKAAESADYSVATEAQKGAVRRLMQFIADVTPAGADPADINTFTSAEFVARAGEYFDVDYLLTYYLWTEFFVSVDQRAKNILWRTWDGLKWYPTYYDGDTQRGKRNDSFMVYDPETERGTWDVSGNKWAFEGHDSWLWCLVLANMQERLSVCARALMGALTADRTVDMLINEQSGNWSDRQFNKSGELKYITPAVRELNPMNFIYALQGADREHSEWFIRQRWALMAAKYGSDEYRGDNIDCYIVRDSAQAPSVVKITGYKTYAYGYGTNNVPTIFTTGIVPAGVEAAVPIRETYTQNDPVRIYGASRIVKLDLTGASDALANGVNLGKCSALEEIDAHVPEGGQASAVAWWLDSLRSCPLLRRIDVRGQQQFSTSSAAKELDISALTRVEDVDARGTRITTAAFAPGSALHTLRLPATMETLVLEHQQNLSTLTCEGLQSLKTIKVQGCPAYDPRPLVQAWLSTKTTADSGCTLDISGVNWTIADSSMLEQLLQLGSLHIAGRIHIEKAVTPHFIERCKEVLGDDCFIPGSELHISYTDIVVLDDDTLNPAFFACVRKAGWCSDEHVMARHEAEAVTNNMLETSKKVGDEWVMQRNTSIETMDEFGFFTGVSEIPVSFMNCYGTNNDDRCLRCVTIPPNVQRIMGAAFYGNIRLERITMLPMTAPVFQSDVFRDSGLQLPEGTPKILEIPRGSTGYVGADNTPVYTALQGYTIAYID